MEIPPLSAAESKRETRQQVIDCAHLLDGGDGCERHIKVLFFSTCTQPSSSSQASNKCCTSLTHLAPIQFRELIIMQGKKVFLTEVEEKLVSKKLIVLT